MRRITAMLVAAVFVATGLLAALTALTAVMAVATPAVAEATLMYVDKDVLMVYEGMGEVTRVVLTLPGGTAISAAQAADGWYAISYIDGNGAQLVGYARSEDLSDTMPPAYCAHEWSEWMVTQPPTCTSEGTAVRRCDRCWTAWPGRRPGSA